MLQNSVGPEIFIPGSGFIIVYHVLVSSSCFLLLAVIKIVHCLYPNKWCILVTGLLIKSVFCISDDLLVYLSQPEDNNLCTICSVALVNCCCKWYGLWDKNTLVICQRQ